MIKSKNLALWVSLVLLPGTLMIACTGTAPDETSHTTATTPVSPPAVQALSVVQPPERIEKMREQRGELEQAAPVVRIVSPANNSVIDGPTVQVRVSLSGDLKGYKPGQDPATGMGDHIHVILDNEPYEAYYDLSAPFEFKDVAPGRHTLRVFASRPWHESYKNEGSFHMVSFTVRGSAASPAPASPSPAMGEKPAPDGPDPSRPLLTYSRPKGEYKGEEADPIMIDFWLTNARLKGDGDQYRIRYIIDDGEPGYIDRWAPVWLAGWANGKHSVRLELLGSDDRPVENGNLNTTTREITVIK
jgi:hypothetical protein